MVDSPTEASPRRDYARARVRILTVGNMYPPEHLGGYELMWRSAVAHQRARGHEVRVLTTDWRGPAADGTLPEDADVHRELRWYWHDHRFPRMGPRARLRLERHNATVLDAHLERFRPDVVAWWAMGGMSLSLIERARRAGRPAAAVVVDDWLVYGPKVDAWWRLLHRPARRLEDACEWVFCSQVVRRRAEEAGFRPAAASVIYPGIDLDLFSEPPGGRPPWRWQLLYCGRIDPRKGIDLAIEALVSLPLEATLRVVGGGDERELARLERLATDRGVRDRVAFERHRRDALPAIYASADAVVFPVRWIEPFGLVPLEAMACGAPVVATGRGGSGEYLRDGENCVLFDPDAGPPALADAIRRVAHDAELRSRLHEGGLATAVRFPERAFNDGVLEALHSARGGAVAEVGSCR